MKKEFFLIGAHTSTQGGLHNALLEASEIGATTAQIFTSNQKQWRGRILTQEMVEKWNKTLEETGLEKIMSHASYLINLGSCELDKLKKSRHAFQQEILRCQELGIAYLNFHPGAAVGQSPAQCLDTIVDSLVELETLLQGSPTRLLLEATAGQGSCVGWQFEELAYILSKVKDQVPIGVCIDTCHIFAAGYDIRTKSEWEKTLHTFDQVVGLEHLFAFHLNDSLGGLGSRVDRHRPLGQGEIGLEAFRFLMQDPRTKSLPLYLETPGGLPLWKEEIRLLKELAKE